MRSRTVLVLRALRWLMEEMRVHGPSGRAFEGSPHGQEGHDILQEIEQELDVAEGEGDAAIRTQG